MDPYHIEPRGSRLWNTEININKKNYSDEIILKKTSQSGQSLKLTFKGTERLIRVTSNYPFHCFQLVGIIARAWG